MNARADLSTTLLQFLFKRKSGFVAVVIALAFIVASAITAFPQWHAARAAGAASISVSPGSLNYNPPDSLITVTGVNFGTHETVNVYWNYTGPGTGTLEGSATTASGKFLFHFATPLTATGTYTIGAVGATSGLSATGTFRSLPGVFVTPGAAGSGSGIQVTGNDFGAGEVVKIYYAYHGAGTGTLIATATGDSTGSFTVNSTIPAGSTAHDTLSIAGVGQTSNTVGIFKFTHYTPTLALAPLSGSASTPLTVSAYGFEAGENVFVYWNNGTTPVATGTTDVYGYLAPFSITVPAGSTPGAYQVKAVGQTTKLSIANTYTVVAASSGLNVTSGPVGGNVNVTGQGYTPGETVKILWNYTVPGTGTNVATVTAGYAGAISASFTVPASANGTYNVAAAGASSNRITENAFAIQNSLAASPASTSPGKSITIAGSGFNANESVNLYWDSTSTLLTTTTANANGCVNLSVALSASATPGSHNILGIGQGSSISLTAPVSINTNWGDFGLGEAIHRVNAYENSISTANVGLLKLRWNVPVATNNLGSPSPVYANGVVYLATPDGLLNAYDATTGTVKWQFNPNTQFPTLSSPLVDPGAGLVFYGSLGHQNPGSPSPFYAVDVQTGKLKWSVILACNEFGEPALAFKTIYIGTSLKYAKGGSLYALDELTGHMNWHYDSVGGIWGEVGADTSTNTVYAAVGDPDYQIISFNASTGAINWQFAHPVFGNDQDTGSGIGVANGLIYLSSKNGYVYALNESNGTVAWATQIARVSADDVSTPAISNGVLYVGSLDNLLYALNAANGQVIWQAANVGGIDSSPAVANGIVYFASFNGKIYALDANTHAVLWSYATGGKSFSSPIVVNGWLYCGSESGNLYAFSL